MLYAKEGASISDMLRTLRGSFLRSFFFGYLEQFRLTPELEEDLTREGNVFRNVPVASCGDADCESNGDSQQGSHEAAPIARQPVEGKMSRLLAAAAAAIFDAMVAASTVALPGQWSSVTSMAGGRTPLNSLPLITHSWKAVVRDADTTTPFVLAHGNASARR
uniref:Uncharacterized protein n=1 Tax=Rhipicephalus microplus TaxID=6941 RepID=A0A6G5AIM2_RHIMP